MKKIKSIIIEVAVITIIFSIVIIADLVDIQIKDSSQNSINIQDMQGMLSNQKKELYRIENDIIKIKNQMAELKKDVSSGKKDSKGWNQKVIKYNHKIEQYNSKMKEYNKKMNKYYDDCLRYEKRMGVKNWMKSVVGTE